MKRSLYTLARVVVVVAAGLAAEVETPAAQAPPPAGGKTPVHAKQVKRMLVKGAMVIPGTGMPAYGPIDILLENGLIARIGSGTARKWPEADAIDRRDRQVRHARASSTPTCTGTRSGSARCRFSTSATCISPPA